MRRAFFQLLLFFLFFFSYPAILFAQIPLAAPSIPVPESEALSVSLPLVLSWKDVPGAFAYRYELIGYQENKEPKEFLVTKPQSDPPSPDVLKFLEPQHPAQWYQDECKKLKNKDENKDGKLDECTGKESLTFLTKEQKRFWHAKSCEDAEGMKCGPWGDVWDFTYLLAPPKTLAPASGNIGLPVRFDWDEVIGAESYLFKGEIDFSNGFWGNFAEFISAPGSFGVNFILKKLGVIQDAVACPYALWDETEEGCIALPINKDDKGALPSDYADDVCFFTKDTKYTWEVASCLGENGTLCGEFSEERSFQTTPAFTIPAPQLKEPLYDPKKPEVIPVVSLQDALSWDGHECGQYHKVTITKDGEKKPLLEAVDIGSLGLNSEAVEKVWKGLDTVYTWQATPCWIGNDKEVKCEPIGSEIWKFKTTGAAPKNLKSSFKKSVEISWDAVPKAGSYHYQVATSSAFSLTSIKKEEKITALSAIIDHPDIAPATQYWWRVRACADLKGEICGAWSEVKTFTTFPVKPPPAPEQPEDKGEMFLPGILSWKPDPGASYYQYQVQYTKIAVEETAEDCRQRVGSQIFQPFPVTNGTSFFLDEICAGEYKWAVRSCFERTCEEKKELTSAWTKLWTFQAKELPVGESFGLVPCARKSNNPATPYNEKQPCQFKHLGFLLQNILDFVLWKVSLLVLLILAVISGATSYFSLGKSETGKPETLKKIRAMFRSFFAGFLILMFAWMFVNIVLMRFGFDFKFFGRWWEISF